MRFASRKQAGQWLGEHLQARGAQVDLVLGLPRGGVVVAAEVARLLKCPLAALVVRKIGHPRQREMAVGAVAEPDVVVFDAAALHWRSPDQAEIEAVKLEELHRLRHYQKLFHPAGMPALRGKCVGLVDDGLATGATMDAAVRSVRQREAARVMVAVPVASGNAMSRIGRIADEVVALEVDEDFMAVGCYYENFAQVGDAEVLGLLLKGRV